MEKGRKTIENLIFYYFYRYSRQFTICYVNLTFYYFYRYSRQFTICYVNLTFYYFYRYSRQFTICYAKCLPNLEILQIKSRFGSPKIANFSLKYRKNTAKLQETLNNLIYTSDATLLSDIYK